MTDKLHPETGLAKIRRGDTSPIRKIQVEATRVQKPNKPNPFVAQHDRNLQIDLESGPLAAWWNHKTVNHLQEIVSKRSRIAQDINSLQHARSQAIAHDTLFDAKLELEHALLLNQAEVLRQATERGLHPEHWSQHVLRVLEAELEAQKKELQGKTDLRIERFSLEETFRAVLTKQALTFDYHRNLIDEVTKLATDLVNVDTENLPPSAKEIKKKHLRRLIELKEREIASQQETFPQGNRTGVGRIVEEPTEASGPEE